MQKLRYIFFLLIVRSIMFFILGTTVHHREKLPLKGPAIILSNHNSHLDILMIMSLFPMRMLSLIHPVAAADYFLRNKYLAWFATQIIGIVPIDRKKITRDIDPFQHISGVLRKNGIVIFFPEGTRGEPEQLSKFKTGIAHLAEQFPQVPISPIFLYGTGKVLPKGEALLVPFMVDVQIGDSIYWNHDKRAFIENLETQYKIFLEKPQSARDYSI